MSYSERSIDASLKSYNKSMKCINYVRQDLLFVVIQFRYSFFVICDDFQNAASIYEYADVHSFFTSYILEFLQVPLENMYHEIFSNREQHTTQYSSAINSVVHRCQFQIEKRRTTLRNAHISMYSFKFHILVVTFQQFYVFYRIHWQCLYKITKLWHTLYMLMNTMHRIAFIICNVIQKGNT